MRLFIKDREFYRTVLVLSLPIAAQQCITAGVNMMDTMMLGRVGETALAASAAGVTVHNLFQTMSMGMGMGASVMVARFWGSGERISLRKTLTIAYRFCLLISALFTLLVALFPETLMHILSADADVIAEGMRYLRWSLPCYLLHALSLVTTIVLRTSKQMRIPLISSIGAFFINIFFNWIFIFGKLGAPQMGVAGAALGTLISRSFEVVVICGYFFFLDQKIRFRIPDIFKRCADLVSEYFRVSVPVMISDTFLGLGNSAIMAVGGYVGPSFMAAASVTSVTRQMIGIFNAALGQPAVFLTGNTLGEGNREKAFRQGVTFTSLAFIVGAVSCVLIWIFTPLILSMYKLTPETYDMAEQLMHALAVLMILMCPASILTKGVLRGGGDTRFLMLADILFLWVVSIPLGYAAGMIWHLPAFWIFFFLYIDHQIKAIWCTFRLKSGKWMKKIRSAET